GCSSKRPVHPKPKNDTKRRRADPVQWQGATARATEQALMSYSTMLDLIVNGTMAGADVGASDLETNEQHPLLTEARRIADAEGWKPHSWETFRTLLAGAWTACNHYTDWLEPALLRLTEVFPDLVIAVRGMGEDFDDMWRKYYQRGRTFQKDPS